MKHLEPVVKHKNTSFSILLLRNDSKVVRFRLNSFWVKFLVFFFICFTGAAGATAYSAHYYWKKYNNLQRERSELAEKLGENRRRLNEFASIEKIKERQPRSSMVGVGTLGAENGAGNGAPSTPETAGHGTASGGETVSPRLADPPGQAPPAQAGGSAAVPSGAEAPGGTREIIPQANGTVSTTPEAAAAAPGTGDGRPDASRTLSEEDKNHPAFLDKVLVRPSGARSYKLTYELSNREQGAERDQYPSLSGRVLVAVGTKSGTRHEITSVSGDSLRFVIRWGKKVEISFSLPENLSPKEVDKLLLTVEGDNFPSKTFAFPMPQPQNAQQAQAR